MTERQFPVMGGKAHRITVSRIDADQIRLLAGFEEDAEAAEEYAQTLANRDGARFIVSDWQTAINHTVAPNAG